MGVTHKQEDNYIKRSCSKLTRGMLRKITVQQFYKQDGDRKKEAKRK